MHKEVLKCVYDGPSGGFVQVVWQVEFLLATFDSCVHASECVVKVFEDLLLVGFLLCNVLISFILYLLSPSSFGILLLFWADVFSTGSSLSADCDESKNAAEGVPVICCQIC